MRLSATPFDSLFEAKLAFNDRLETALDAGHHVTNAENGRWAAEVVNPETGTKRIYKLKQVKGKEGYHLETTRYTKPITSLKADDKVNLRREQQVPIKSEKPTPESTTSRNPTRVESSYSTGEKKYTSHSLPSSEKEHQRFSNNDSYSFGQKNTSPQSGSTKSKMSFREKSRQFRKDVGFGTKVALTGVGKLCQAISEPLLLIALAFA